MKKFVVLMMLFSFGLFGVALNTGCGGPPPATVTPDGGDPSDPADPSNPGTAGEPEGDGGGDAAP